jgi:hypothetical protein
MHVDFVLTQALSWAKAAGRPRRIAIMGPSMFQIIDEELGAD